MCGRVFWGKKGTGGEVLKRHLVGIFAVVLLLVGVALTLWPPGETGYQQFLAAAWRVGALMAVLWLAYPEVIRMPVWILGTIPALVVVLAVKPKWFVIALPVMILLVVLSPRRGPRQ